MRDKQTHQNVSAAVTFNIITDKVQRFISLTATYRTPSLEENARADWRATLVRNGVTIHVVGRGDELTTATLQAYARAYLDGRSTMWKHVNLAALTDESGDDPVTDMSDDPVWQRIKAIAAGGAL